MCKISVIIPVYNCEKYLEQCIESILNQSEKDIEIIIVDDGSTDNTPIICDKYVKKDNRVRVIHKDNDGVAVARNVGIDIATGEYIAFVDADDYLEKKVYENMYNEMKKENLDFIIWNYKFIKNNESEINKDFPETIIIDDKENIDSLSATVLCPLILNLRTPNNKIIGMGFPWNKLFKTSIIKHNHLLFPVGVTLNEDIVFIFKYMKYIHKMKIINEVYYNYRILQDGATLKYKPNIVENNNRIFYELNNEFNNMTDCQRKAYWCRVIRCLANVCNGFVCHKQNNENRIKLIKSILMEQPIYKEAIKTVDFKYLTQKQKILVLLIKYRLYFAFKFL